MLALLFGVRLSFLAYSLVLALQSLLFGAGGITALAVNALAMGLAGSIAAVLAFRGLRRLNGTPAVAVAAWLSVVLPGLLVALALGVQPLIAHKEDGPRYVYFPAKPTDHAREDVLAHVVQTYFAGSPEDAVTALLRLSDADLSDAEIRKLREKIRGARSDERQEAR